MPWVWSDDVAARLVEAGLVDPEALRAHSVPAVAVAVEDPEDLVGLVRTFFPREIEGAA